MHIYKHICTHTHILLYSLLFIGPLSRKEYEMKSSTRRKCLNSDMEKI